MEYVGGKKTKTKIKNPKHTTPLINYGNTWQITAG